MKSGNLIAKKVLAIGAVFLFGLSWFSCEVPASTKGTGGGGPAEPTNKKYPCIDLVTALPQNLVYTYDDSIMLDSFTVYYLESAESERRKLEPATETVEGFLINGKKKGGEFVKAGITTAGVKGKYGDFTLKFTASEDPTAVPFELKVFVGASKVDAGDTMPTKLEVVREPNQTIYDRGEPFLPYGMVVVAWYNETAAGETIDVGGKPLVVPDAKLQIDDTSLTTATSPGASVKVSITYTYATGQTPLQTQYVPILNIAAHQITAIPKQGVKYKVEQTASTGAYVTVGVKTDEDYELAESGGLKIASYDKSGQELNAIEFSEISPETDPEGGGDYQRFVFVMPRYEIKMSTEIVQKASGLGSLEYKIIDRVADFTTVPGFEDGTHHLMQQLLVDSDEGTPDKPITIQAGPPAELGGGEITISIGKAGETAADTQKTMDEANPKKVSLEITDLLAGNTDYAISVLYEKGGVASDPRNYIVRLMREDESNHSITYTYNGTYQNGTNQQNGTYQIFIASKPGRYLIEAWGANGGDAPPGGTGTEHGYGGKGGYVKGELTIPATGDFSVNTPLYIYVGGKGGSHNPSAQYVPGLGGWNGGGRGGNSGSKAGGGGGGATSISLVAGAWNSLDVLGNRILVAGGGGGATPWGKGASTSVHSPELAPAVNGSVGGGIAGSPAVTINGKKYGPFSADIATPPWTLLVSGYTLTPGQAQPPDDDPTAGLNGQGFGHGGYGRDGDLPIISNGDGYNGKGGGGGGWWGGRVSLYRGSDNFAHNAAAGGGGGSNYISGFSSCYGVTEVSGGIDLTTFEYSVSVTSNTSSSVYYGSSGASARPTAGSPGVGTVQFFNPSMNAWNSTTYEADPLSEDLNAESDGNGKLIITYMGNN